jgi:hypothetical protein
MLTVRRVRSLLPNCPRHAKGFIQVRNSPFTTPLARESAHVNTYAYLYAAALTDYRHRIATQRMAIQVIRAQGLQQTRTSCANLPRHPLQPSLSPAS